MVNKNVDGIVKDDILEGFYYYHKAYFLVVRVTSKSVYVIRINNPIDKQCMTEYPLPKKYNKRKHCELLDTDFLYFKKEGIGSSTIHNKWRGN